MFLADWVNGRCTSVLRHRCVIHARYIYIYRERIRAGKKNAGKKSRAESYVLAAR